MRVMGAGRSSLRVLGVVGATAGLGLSGLLVPASAGAAPLDPSTLSRGPDPTVTYLVRDTIRDGARRLPATHLGRHMRLWDVRGGHLLQDWVQRHGRYRLVFVGGGHRAGEKVVIGRSRLQMSAVVSPRQTRVAWTHGRNELRTPTRVTVTDPSTGQVVASRRFRWARVLGVTSSRVLLSRRGTRPRTTTVWWNYRRGTVTAVADRAGLRADLSHDRLVLASGRPDTFCNRVVPLSRPGRTLWRSCRWAPHSWSPDGNRVTATHTYFDDVGTDRWLALRDHDATRLGRIVGRFSWDSVWEDNQHFLTLALGDSGNASIIRCSTSGRCERASRLWNVGTATYQPNYIPPLVVLASN